MRALGGRGEGGRAARGEGRRGVHPLAPTYLAAAGGDALGGGGVYGRGGVRGGPGRGSEGGVLPGVLL